MRLRTVLRIALLTLFVVAAMATQSWASIQATVTVFVDEDGDDIPDPGEFDPGTDVYRFGGTGEVDETLTISLRDVPGGAGGRFVGGSVKGWITAKAGPDFVYFGGAAKVTGAFDTQLLQPAAIVFLLEVDGTSTKPQPFPHRLWGRYGNSVDMGKLHGDNMLGAGASVNLIGVHPEAGLAIGFRDSVGPNQTLIPASKGDEVHGPPAGGNAPLHLVGSVTLTATGNGSFSDFGDDFEAEVTPIPEPPAFAVWCFLTFLGTSLGWRRRHRRHSPK